ncbi:hypothetical protein BpHYR1_034568 [Brachionus plicatilis]|uniref:Uncharacterized protein n=1 Tax=Brachionus plicatilis TaxID=10195 RepID=A0A3M7PXI4_BRAPC|nr:hypothetical protein BpHYR1_034568 [Brachionus plicatilis]
MSSQFFFSIQNSKAWTWTFERKSDFLSYDLHKNFLSISASFGPQFEDSTMVDNEENTEMGPKSEDVSNFPFFWNWCD